MSIMLHRAGILEDDTVAGGTDKEIAMQFQRNVPANCPFSIHSENLDAGTSNNLDFWNWVQGGDGGSPAGNDGENIQVWTGSGQTGTRLPFELVQFENGAGEKELVGWSMNSSAMTSSSTLYLHLSQTGSQTLPADSAAFGRDAVWTDYDRVYHDCIVDSSGNGADNTGSGITAITGADRHKFHPAQGFDTTWGSAANSNVPTDYQTWATDGMVLEALCWKENNVICNLFGKGTGTGSIFRYRNLNSNHDYRATVDYATTNADHRFNESPALDAWHWVLFQFDAGNTTDELYLARDDVTADIVKSTENSGTDGVGGLVSSTANMKIGNQPNNNNTYDGKIGSVRFASPGGLRDDDWANATMWSYVDPAKVWEGDATATV